MFDSIIANGTVIDGSGAPKFAADVAVKNGKIAQIAPHITAPCRRRINAAGKLVTPGFVDIHRHADIHLFADDFGKAELRQGITTLVNGNCGLSVIPCPAPYRDEILSFLEPVIGSARAVPPFTDFASYFAAAQQVKLPLHCGMLIGNGTVRAAVKGYATGALSAQELQKVQNTLRTSLQNGALGVTLGIVYAPEYNYTAEQFIEVLQPMREFKVPLVTHIRGEGDNFSASLQEVLTIAKALAVPLHISHLKCIGRRNWGIGTEKALRLIDAARADGMDVTCDAYPYTAGSTQLVQILPPQYLEGGAQGIVAALQDAEKRKKLAEILENPSDAFENLVNLVGWDNIILSTLQLPEHQIYSGKSVCEIAAMQHKTPFDCACDLLIAERCKISMIDHITAESDIKTILRKPYCSVISDSIYPSAGVPHPRLYGTFPRVLARYVRAEGVLSVEDAIHKMTALPAAVYGLQKGLLATGRDADINVFDLAKIDTKATYEQPKQYAIGFDAVLVAGEIAVENDVRTEVCAGTMIRRKECEAKGQSAAL
ncbi:MAG: amidohydrolase family protein [Ruthenibacterium sp.]